MTYSIGIKIGMHRWRSREVSSTGLLALAGTGKGLWGDQGADAYIRRLREGLVVSRIFWDSNLFIYLYERDELYFDRLHAMLLQMTHREDELVTSWLAIAELQVQPRRTGQSQQCTKFIDAMREQTTILAFDESAAETFVAIRARTSVRGPDAIQLACAGAYGVEVFITNDRALQPLRVPGIHFITGLDQVPL